MSNTLAVSEVLSKAADLIEPEGAWTQHTHARDREGNDDFVTAEEAVCFCALGAISVAYGSDPFDEAGWNAQSVLRDMLPERSIPDWNDAPERTQAEVVAKLREAAERAKGGDQ